MKLIPTSVCEKKKREAEAATKKAQGIKTASDGDNKKLKRTRSIWQHKTLRTEEFRWCTVEEFTSREKTSFVEPFKFAVTSQHGSVSPDLELCKGSDTGHIVFSSLFRHMFEEHKAGRTWEGELKLEHLIISETFMLCAIIKETTKLSDPGHIQEDVDSLVSSLLPLYKVNDRLPPYYDDMVERSKEAPDSIAAEDLAISHKEMLKQCCFVPFETRVLLVLESHINNKNLHSDEKKAFDNSAPKNLENYLIIHKVDKLLDDVVLGGIRQGIKLEPKFDDEGDHMRHVVVHAPEKLDKKLKLHFPLIERDMLMSHYYKKYLPEFVKLMFAERANQPWLNVLCELYERAILVKTTIPRAAIPLSVEDVEDEPTEEEGEQGEAQAAASVIPSATQAPPASNGSAS